MSSEVLRAELMFGTCCPEMDIWEANSNAAAYTPHTCTVTEQTQCSGVDCGAGADRYNGVCDKDGCDFNSWRMGDRTFFGPGSSFLVDTTQPFTVVTQFVTNNNSISGTLSSIKRIYVQNGNVIQNSNTDLTGVTTTNAISDTFCNQQKTAVGDTNSFEARGGLTSMGSALGKGMVLALSLWDDHEADMLWLDSNYPLNASVTAPGVSRGLCSATSGDPNTVQSQQPNAVVAFSNIKVGPIGSTFSATGGSTDTGTGTGTGTGSGTTGASAPTGTQVAEFGQCGRETYTGSTTCATGTTCVFMNPFYSQCLVQ
ncbi:glycosyl hydrolase family 7-domain-containing protein [Mycena amicta]|nr:glycosyl hydrolase family 7-domain-containing protein [Mycena amicta]